MKRATLLLGVAMVATGCGSSSQPYRELVGDSGPISGEPSLTQGLDRSAWPTITTGPVAGDTAGWTSLSGAPSSWRQNAIAGGATGDERLGLALEGAESGDLSGGNIRSAVLEPFRFVSDVVSFPFRGMRGEAAGQGIARETPTAGFQAGDPGPADAAEAGQGGPGGAVGPGAGGVGGGVGGAGGGAGGAGGGAP